MEAGWSLFPVIKKRGTQKDFRAQEPHRALLGFGRTFLLLKGGLPKWRWDLLKLSKSSNCETKELKVTLVNDRIEVEKDTVKLKVLH